MTPEELLAAAEAGTLNMDSDESVTTQPATPAADTAPTDTATTTTASHPQDELVAPIASKSGAYTIPYEKLAQAREQAKAFASENELLRAQIAQLSAVQAANLAQAQAQDRADAGQAATRQDTNLAMAQQAVADGANPEIFGDFSEEGIAKGVETLVDKRMDERVEQKVQQAIAPLLQERQAVAQQTAAEAHINAIYAAHPDADEIAQSAEFAKWHDSLPSFARAAVDRVMAHGETAEVVEVFSTFKAQAQIKPAAPAGSKVQQAIATAASQAAVPISLSELTGQASSGNPAEQIAALTGDPDALMARMAEMTPAQREKLMNSV